MIIIAAVAAYHGSFSGPFVLDDIDSIIANPTIRHLWPIGRVLSPPAELTVGGRPLLNLSLAVNYAVSGLRVGGYHAVNLAIHGLAGLALFGLARRTLARTAPALVIALLWTLHPIQTEAVTYVIQRAESLAGLLYLLTVYAFIRAAEREPFFAEASAGEKAARRKRGFWLGLSWLACLFGMAVKETMVTAPVAVLLYDRTFVAGSFGAAWRRRRWFYAALAATWLPLAMLVATTGWSRGGSAGFGIGATAGTYGLTQVKAVVHYLRLALWPHPLVFDYGLGLATSARSVALPGLVIAACPDNPRAHNNLGFLLLHGGRTAEAERCFETALRLYPDYADAHYNLGNAWLLTGREADAAGQFDGALRLSPDDAEARNNLGIAPAESGRLADAAVQFAEAVRLKPNYAKAHGNLGGALAAQDDLPAAIAQYQEALRLDPGLVEIRANLGLAFLREGRLGEAKVELERVLRTSPDYAPAREGLMRLQASSPP